MSTAPPAPPRPRDLCLQALRRFSSDDRRVRVVTLAAVLLFLGAALSRTSADVDLWHEMAWARESWKQGAFLREDCFSYRATVSPVVHHEWGTGVILYATYRGLGWPGLLLVRYAAIGLTAVVVVRAALRRGARRSVLTMCALLAIPLVTPWMGTVRAQVFTLLAVSLLLSMLDRERSRRVTLLGMGTLFLVWLNLHAGFVAGLALLAAHAIEEALRRRPVMPWIASVGLGVALIPLSPWGVDYYDYLRRAIPMMRSSITEWVPMHEASGALLTFYAVTLGLTVYAMASLGPRRIPGILMVLVSALAAARHIRHASILGVVWLVVLPAALTRTPLGRAAIRFRRRHPAGLTAASFALLLPCLVIFFEGQPWRVRLPADRESSAHPYPLGAVESLRATGFQGHLITPFEVGAFVSFQLFPAVKVSLDSRYEVAYPAELLEEQAIFFAGQPGWRESLTQTGADAALVPQAAPVKGLLDAVPDWTCAYQDTEYAVYLRRR